MNRVVAAGVAIASALTIATPLMAGPSGVRVGTLSCREAHGWGYVLGGSRHVSCAFDGNGRSERYSGSLSKYGVDIGYHGAGTLVWAVFAPTSNIRRGDLAGHYAGVTGGAAVGVGAAGNALIGGFDHSVTLQPVSIEGQTGLNVAAGIGALSLNYQRGRAGL
jgi:hypothetical protein